MLRLALFMGVALTATVGAQAETRADREASSLSAEQASTKVVISGHDDALEPSIWITTEPFLRKPGNEDKFLRANIDKVTGEVFYQLYFKGGFTQRLDFNRMTLLVNGQLQEAPVSLISADVSCDRFACSHYLDFVVDLTRPQMEALANEGAEAFWTGRLFGRSQQGVDIVLLKNETQGLLLAVDRLYRDLQGVESSPAEPEKNAPTSAGDALIY